MNKWEDEGYTSGDNLPEGILVTEERLGTPDTELEDNIKSALSSNPALRDKILALIPAKKGVVTPDTEIEDILDRLDGCVVMERDVDLQYAILDHKKAEPIIQSFRTSRDTYWKEKLDWRNRKDGTKFHDGDDVVQWYDKQIESITNEDNLK